MRRRVFIAINLPESVKKELSSFQLKWPELPCRWTKKENLHITLEFLGYLTDEELFELCQKTKEIASSKKSFTAHLNKICYGPVDKKPLRSLSAQRSSRRSPRSSSGGAPSMLWAVGDKIKELGITPHITLGRLKMLAFRQMESEERPEINEEINLSFEVNSIEVMESRLKRTGPEYTILQSCPLKS